MPVTEAKKRKLELLLAGVEAANHRSKLNVGWGMVDKDREKERQERTKDRKDPRVIRRKTRECSSRRKQRLDAAHSRHRQQQSSSCSSAAPVPAPMQAVPATNDSQELTDDTAVPQREAEAANQEEGDTGFASAPAAETQSTTPTEDAPAPAAPTQPTTPTTDGNLQGAEPLPPVAARKQDAASSDGDAHEAPVPIPPQPTTPMEIAPPIECLGAPAPAAPTKPTTPTTNGDLPGAKPLPPVAARKQDAASSADREDQEAPVPIPPQSTTPIVMAPPNNGNRDPGVAPGPTQSTKPTTDGHRKGAEPLPPVAAADSYSDAHEAQPTPPVERPAKRNGAAFFTPLTEKERASQALALRALEPHKDKAQKIQDQLFTILAGCTGVKVKRIIFEWETNKYYLFYFGMDKPTPEGEFRVIVTLRVNWYGQYTIVITQASPNNGGSQDLAKSLDWESMCLGTRVDLPNEISAPPDDTTNCPIESHFVSDTKKLCKYIHKSFQPRRRVSSSHLCFNQILCNDSTDLLLEVFTLFVEDGCQVTVGEDTRCWQLAAVKQFVLIHPTLCMLPCTPETLKFAKDYKAQFMPTFRTGPKKEKRGGKEEDELE